MAKAILFDLDGTLVNTLEDLANATNTVIAANGYPTQPLDAYRQFVGSGARMLLARAMGVSGEDVSNTVFEQFLAEYDRRLLETVAPYDGVIATLDALAEVGFLFGVVTNKPHEQAVRLVRHLFGDRFGCIFGGCDAYPRKPDPACVTFAAEALGVAVSDCVMVGDSDVDVFTAHAAGIPCIGCTFGFRGEAELRGAGVDALAYSFPEIAKNGLIFK